MRKFLALTLALLLGTTTAHAQTPAPTDANETFTFKTNKGTLKIRTVGTPCFKGVNNSLADNYEATAWIEDKGGYYTLFNKKSLDAIEAHQSYAKNKVLYYNWEQDGHITVTDRTDGYVKNPYVNGPSNTSKIISDIPSTDILGYIFYLRLFPEKVTNQIYGVVDRGILYRTYTKTILTPQETTYIITLEGERNKGTATVTFSNDNQKIPLNLDISMPKYRIKGTLAQ